jgi:transcription elongation GreA/GreB family factor
MKEDIKYSANEIFKINTLYKRKEIEDLLKKNKISFINITAYTYNRWNKGMNEIIELFEYISRDTYKYIGTKEISNYSGPVFHNPLGKNHEYKIGDWKNGAFKFLNKSLNTFNDWKESEYDGISVVIIRSKITFETLDGSIKQLKIITTDVSEIGKADGKYIYIALDSNLGKLLIHKCLNEEFEFGNNKFKITNIIY